MNDGKMIAMALAVVGTIAMGSPVFAQDTSSMTQPMYTTDANRISVGDQIFLMDLMHANALEVELSMIALHDAGSKGVSEYAQMMIDDHTALQNQLATTYGSQYWMMSWKTEMQHKTMMQNAGTDYSNMGGMRYGGNMAMSQKNGNMTDASMGHGARELGVPQRQRHGHDPSPNEP